jgi:hypothetical protein
MKMPKHQMMMKKYFKKDEDEDNWEDDEEDEEEDDDVEIDVDDDEDDFEDEENIDYDNDGENEDLDIDIKGKKCSKCSKSKKYMHKKGQKMKEHKEFFKKLKNQTGFTFFDLNKDGSFKEDSIIPPEDPNAKIVINNNVNPGDVGFSPDTRIGQLNSNNFAEWTSKFKKRKK